MLNLINVNGFLFSLLFLPCTKCISFNTERNILTIKWEHQKKKHEPNREKSYHLTCAYSKTCVREPPSRLTLNSGWCGKSCLSYKGTCHVILLAKLHDLYLYKTTTFTHQPLRSISKVALLHRFYCTTETEIRVFVVCTLQALHSWLQTRPMKTWSDCANANAQADLNLCWKYVSSETMFSDVVAPIYSGHKQSQHITKTRLFKYIENFTTIKIENFQIKNPDNFTILLKI